jgi:hypothetical protein
MEQMLKNTRLQMIAMLAIGALLGHAAASCTLQTAVDKGGTRVCPKLDIRLPN